MIRHAMVVSDPGKLPVTPISVSPPAWVDRLVSGSGPVVAVQGRPTTERSVVLRRGASETLVSIEVPGALALSRRRLERAVFEAYGELFDILSAERARHPVRLWNFVPGILEPLGGLPHRYMVFNAGRYRALCAQHGGARRLPISLATATGVGHDGDSYVLHCLTSSSPGTPIENPRQVPAYRYSKRFGPRPPCFARATRWRPGVRAGDAAELVLVGGTASVRGEETVHAGDLRAQAEETLVNLESLIRAALPDPRSGAVEGPLGLFRDLRVYHPLAHAAAEIEQQVAASFPSLRSLELVPADLCRDDLLIEIEGVAELS